MGKRWTGGAVLAALLTVAGPAAEAHARLVASAPAANSAGPAVPALVLSFSEPVEPPLAKVEVSLSGAAVSTTLQATGPKELTLSFAAPLVPGIYAVHWRVVASDMHKSEGDFTFTVK